MYPKPFPFISIPTGSLRLDYALGNGGFPRGCYIEMRGPESSGKTTLCLHTISEAQKRGSMCAIIDSDFSIYPDYARQCGVDLNRLFISQPNSAEQAFYTLETLAQSAVFDLIVLDSITTLVPEEDLRLPLWMNSKINRDQLLSNSLSKLAICISRSGTSVIFTKQNLKQLSSIYHGLAKNPSRLALGLQAKVRLDLFPGETIKERKNFLGRNIQVKIVKNIICPQFYSAEFDIIMYNKGLDKSGEILTFGSQLDIINKTNTGLYYQGINLGVNHREAVHFLDDHVDLISEIEMEIRQMLFSPALKSTTVSLTDIK
jgi:recombination protein RecA